jgi:hypothetical protein
VGGGIHYFEKISGTQFPLIYRVFLGNGLQSPLLGRMLGGCVQTLLVQKSWSIWRSVGMEKFPPGLGPRLTFPRRRTKNVSSRFAVKRMQ